jgi:hypothetical protein
MDSAPKNKKPVDGGWTTQSNRKRPLGVLDVVVDPKGEEVRLEATLNDGLGK